MVAWNGQGLPVNSFALVAYLPGPLATFLDRIRHDFAPDSRAKAHLTILPPRPLMPSPDPANIDAAWDRLRNQLQDIQPFQVELGEVEVFPQTHAIYISIRSGLEELKRLHDLLNAGGLAFEEPYSFHPHVTIAQELAPEDVPEAAQFARWRWDEFKPSRCFTVERLTFVQNSLENYWTDLAELDLTSSVTR